MGDVVALGGGEVGLAGEEGVELAAAGGVGVVAELAEDRAGVGPVAERRQAEVVSRSMIARAGSTPFCRLRRFCSAWARRSSTL